MWRHVAPAFTRDHRVVLFDHVGAGGSDLTAYSPSRHGRLEGYATDVTEILDALDLPTGDLRRSLGQRHDRRAGRGRPARAVRAPGAALSQPEVHRRRRLPGRFLQAEIDELLEHHGRQLPGLGGARRPGDHGRARAPRARRRAGQQLLPHRPGDRPPVRPHHLPVGQPRRPRPAAHPVPGAAVAARHDRADAGGRPTCTGTCGTASWSSSTRRATAPTSARPTRSSRALRNYLAEDVEAAASEDRWDDAPCGLLALDGDGTVLDANRTVLGWLGRERADVVGGTRLQDLLAVGGRIYWETHLAPLLHADGRFDEVALELVTPSGRLPVVISAVVEPGGTAPVPPVSRSSAPGSARGTSRSCAPPAAWPSAPPGRTRALQHATAALSGARASTGSPRPCSVRYGPLGSRSATLWLPDPGTVVRAVASLAEEAAGPAPAPVLGDLTGRREASRGRTRRRPAARPVRTCRACCHCAYDDAAADPLDLPCSPRRSAGRPGPGPGDPLRAERERRSRAPASLLASARHRATRFAVATTYRPGVAARGRRRLVRHLPRRDGCCRCRRRRRRRGSARRAAMGQLRSAVRAVAGPRRGRPPWCRGWTASSSRSRRPHRHPRLRGARPGDGRFRYACAGHPPPLLVPSPATPPASCGTAGPRPWARSPGRSTGTRPGCS